MEEIKIYHSFWKTFLLTTGCLVIIDMFIRLNGGFNLSEYSFLELLFFCGFGVIGLYFLLVLLKERLFGQPFMTISDNSLVVNRLFWKKVINFCDVRSFDYGINVLGSTVLYIHFRQGTDRVKDSINISPFDANEHNLCILLNKIRTMSSHSSQSMNESQADSLQNLFKEYGAALCSTGSYTRYRIMIVSLIAIIAIAFAPVHPDKVDYSALVSPFLFFLFITVVIYFICRIIPSALTKIIPIRFIGVR